MNFQIESAFDCITHQQQPTQQTAYPSFSRRESGVKGQALHQMRSQENIQRRQHSTIQNQNKSKANQHSIMTISQAEAANGANNGTMRNKMGTFRSQEKKEQAQTNQFSQLIQERLPGNSYQQYENVSQTIKPKTERTHIPHKKVISNQASQLKFKPGVVKNISRLGCRSHEHSKDKTAQTQQTRNFNGHAMKQNQSQLQIHRSYDSQRNKADQSSECPRQNSKRKSKLQITNQQQHMKSTASFGLNQVMNGSNVKLTQSIQQKHQLIANHGQDKRYVVKHNDKENISGNADIKTTDMIKNGMQKFTKFIKHQKSQIMNSNNINIRRNYGSNDSTQGAPAQKKYVITHKFNQSKSNKSKKLGDRRKSNENKNCPSFSNFLARNQQQIQRIPSQMEQCNQDKPKSIIHTGTGSENISVDNNERMTAVQSKQLHKQMPLQDITKQIHELIISEKNESQEIKVTDHSELLNEFNFDQNQFLQTKSSTQATQEMQLSRLNGGKVMLGLTQRDNQNAQNGLCTAQKDVQKSQSTNSLVDQQSVLMNCAKQIMGNIAENQLSNSINSRQISNVYQIQNAKQNNQSDEVYQNYISNQLQCLKYKIQQNQLSQQALFNNEVNQNQIQRSSNQFELSQNQQNKQLQLLLESGSNTNTQSIESLQSNQQMTDKENNVHAIPTHGNQYRQSTLGQFAANKNLRSTSTNSGINGGLKTQQHIPSKVTGLQMHHQGIALRNKNHVQANRRIGTGANAKHAHTRHFKSLSNISSSHGSNASTLKEKDNMPLRLNKNISNMQDQGTIQLGRQTYNKVQKGGSFIESRDESTKSNLFRQSSTNTGTFSNSKKSTSQGQRTKSSTKSKGTAGSGIPHPQIHINVSSPFKGSKADKIKAFRAQVKDQVSTGELYDKNLKDIHECLQQKELLENAQNLPQKRILGSPKNTSSSGYCASPIEGSDVTKEYRTKMMDWMVEVCTSFKCSSRTYFLSCQIFDKYLTKIRLAGKVLQNKDVHSVGVTAMYLASKYEDIYPLHSKIVSDKIAHKAISAKDILKKEKEFLDLFDYDMDFVTHYDFHQTYSDKISRQLKPDICSNQKRLMKLITDMSMILVKMSIQNVDFCKWSPSIITLSTMYAATAFLKHSKKYEGAETTAFCTEVRKQIFTILQTELAEQKKSLAEGSFESRLAKVGDSRMIIQSYQKQFTQETIEQIAMKLVDFYKIFDDWHCGLNQLKKFNKVPIE